MSAPRERLTLVTDFNALKAGDLPTSPRLVLYRGPLARLPRERTI